jgi:hypothetical protein
MDNTQVPPVKDSDRDPSALQKLTLFSQRFKGEKAASRSIFTPWEVCLSIKKTNEDLYFDRFEAFLETENSIISEKILPLKKLIRDEII